MSAGGLKEQFCWLAVARGGGCRSGEKECRGECRSEEQRRTVKEKSGASGIGNWVVE